jgi:hypothetical protein
LEALEICKRWKILYSCDVALEWNDTDSGDLVAKKLEGGGGKNTLGGVDGEIVFLKYGKKLTKWSKFSSSVLLAIKWSNGK